jgi:hypothetical protein
MWICLSIILLCTSASVDAGLGIFSFCRNLTMCALVPCADLEQNVNVLCIQQEQFLDPKVKFC